jgi:hypothetical protein
MSGLPRRDALFLSVRAVCLLGLSSSSCAEDHLPPVVETDAPVPVDASGESYPDSGTVTNPDSGTVTNLDTTHCDDHGAIVDYRLLDVEVSAGDPCSLRIVKLPDPFEPARFAVLVDHHLVRPVRAIDDVRGDPAYVVTGDRLLLIDDTCTRIREHPLPPPFISVRYGACQLWD